MTINNIELASFFKKLFDPFIIFGLLYTLVRLHQEVFTGYYLMLATIAFFGYSYIYEQINLYRAWRNGHWLVYTQGVLIGWIVVVGLLLLAGHVSRLGIHFSEQVMLIWLSAVPLVLLVSHLVLRLIVSTLRVDGEVRSAVIVGANPPALKLATRIAEYPDLFMAVHGFFDDRNAQRDEGSNQLKMLGKMADIAEYTKHHAIHMVFISQPMSAQPRIRKLIDELQDTTASIYFLPDTYAFDLIQARFDNVGGVPVMAICDTPFIGFNSIVKRTSDLVLATLIQLLLTPVMIAVAVAIKLTSPGPVIFKQRRYGLNGEEIIIYKFRSMKIHDAGAVVQAQKNDSRLTLIGGFLRRSSLDELPQFINVLQGRMSIVGPRPHAVAHNERYRKQIKGYMLRHKVKPGITGWAQVNGMRGETDTLDKMEARIQLDLDYLRNWSLALDIWIIFRTIKVVLMRDNAY